MNFVALQRGKLQISSAMSVSLYFSHIKCSCFSLDPLIASLSTQSRWDNTTIDREDDDDPRHVHNDDIKLYNIIISCWFHFDVIETRCILFFCFFTFGFSLIVSYCAKCSVYTTELTLPRKVKESILWLLIRRPWAQPLLVCSGLFSYRQIYLSSSFSLLLITRSCTVQFLL